MVLWQSLALISLGAALGASARWALGLLLNPLFAFLSFGTLIANYLGCFLIGVLIAVFWQYPHIPSEWRIFWITGFLGSLTTFSSFSAEVVEALLNGKWLAGIGIISLHLFGCLLCTALGVLLWRALT
ncbi:fluoride efflux transporter CrcB [Caviibacterium pharyngocola]|uniref:Fluoride-specific ion channel FluC n=1 Tax=Caviibacterium pharyngocola TaxID=28159 RepID=A0A2M8RXU6_9PAST|nr:fluoride efflux transporter CrcB [Caviibacterium pharyngocola]PJG83711.1 fluoride efflux transporter CrcB [Caviibacterium pharyngocola]